jgi:hypothetical protein
MVEGLVSNLLAGGDMPLKRATGNDRKNEPYRSVAGVASQRQYFANSNSSYIRIVGSNLFKAIMCWAAISEIISASKCWPQVRFPSSAKLYCEQRSGIYSPWNERSWLQPSQHRRFDLPGNLKLKLEILRLYISRTMHDAKDNNPVSIRAIVDTTLPVGICP